MSGGSLVLNLCGALVGLIYASREGPGENQGSKVDALILAESGIHGHMTDHPRTTREDAGKRVDEDMQEATTLLDKKMLKMPQPVSHTRPRKAQM